MCELLDDLAIACVAMFSVSIPETVNNLIQLN